MKSVQIDDVTYTYDGDDLTEDDIHDILNLMADINCYMLAIDNERMEDNIAEMKTRKDEILAALHFMDDDGIRVLKMHGII